MDKDTGLLFVLIERLEKQRLPRLLALKDKVNGGDALDEFDLDFLETMMTDARSALPLISRHPEYQDLTSRIVSLYADITEKDLLLEKGA